ncbi:MAG: hypothetical protein HFE64_09955 [Lachnospiraceae bacterium]|jgi:spore germination protein YaaH|nr:hypothetical protein [Lachnospiraceae bacterium]
MNKIKKQVFFLAAAAALIVISLLAYLGVKVYHYYYGMLRMSAGEYAPVLEAGEYNIVYKGEYKNKAIKVDGQIYLDLDVINEDWAEEMLFYAEDIQKVLYTTPTEMTENEIDRDDFKKWQGRIYMRAELAKEMFGTQYKVNEEDQMVAVQAPEDTIAEVIKSDTYLLVQPDEEERNYTAKLKKGEMISVYETETEGFYLAMNELGYVGYVTEDQIQKTDTKLSRKQPPALEMPEDKLPGRTISLAFQQVYSNEFTAEVYSEIESAGYYINVVSPTWFKLNEEGGIDSLANENYVAWARNQGLQVWALFDNSFDDELTYRVLSDSAKRQALAKELLQYCEKYQLHGINVDFEEMSEKTDHYFIQFLRELSIELRTNGYLLSADCLVPSEWTSYYRRDIMGQLCDYVIVMAYDEHYSGDTVAGSTSSQQFTVSAIYNMLHEEGVSKEKLILGVPYYTRIWMGLENLRSEAVGMTSAKNFIEQNDLTVTYDKETGQNYAEGMVDGTLYRIWIEDAASMKWRLKLMKDNALAGVAAWSLGLESDEIWTAYEEVLFS